MLNLLNKKTAIIVLIVAVIGVYVAKTHWRELPSSVANVVGSDKMHAVKRVKVIRGDQFDIVLDDDTRILAKLKVFAADQAKSKVLDLLNNCEEPKVRLVQKLPDGQWLIDFSLVFNGKDVDLAGWLSSNKLVYQ